MRRRPWRELGLPAKLFVSFALVSVLPIAVLSGLSLRHLLNIQQVSVEETRALLISAQLNRVRERLAEEAVRLSGQFTRLQDEAHALASLAQAVLADPAAFGYRNGSRYRLAADGSFGNSEDDGRSVLFVPRYSPRLAPLVDATETLDLLMRPIAAREPRMVLCWIILREGLTRAFPWRDFDEMPRDKDYTTWPFYYRAGPEENPGREEVFTDLYLDPLSGEWMISCLAPVYVGTAHVATVGIDITVDNLLRDIAAIRVSERSSTLLLSGSSILAASGNLPVARLGLDPTRPSPGQDLARSSENEVRKGVDVLLARSEGVEFLRGELGSFLGFSSVRPPGWKIVILVPESDVIAPAYESAGKVLVETSRIRRNFVHILLFSVLTMVGLTWVVLAHQSRGLREILRGVRQFGEGNLHHRLPAGTGEFGRLAGALNSMADGLLGRKRELQRVYAQVEQERKLSAVGRLAAGVAHEVNNPLATISTYTQLLLRREDLPPDAARDLKTVMDEVQRIQGKVCGLLDLSRAQSPARTTVDLNRLVEEVADLTRHEATARGIALHVNPDPRVPPANLDRSGLKQVLWNLLGNALDAQEEVGTSVRVSTRFVPEGPELVLEVEDEGPGIPEEILPKIFEPFFTTKEVGQGTGLGLAVSYRIVRDHGGRIEVENLRGGGCRFRVWLPLEDGA